MINQIIKSLQLLILETHFHLIVTRYLERII